MPKHTRTLGNNKARTCESLGFVHVKGCASVLTQPRFIFCSEGDFLFEQYSFTICKEQKQML